MAAARSQAPATPPDPEAADAQDGIGAEAEAVAAQAPTPTVFEYTWGDATQYPHIPLTARPARPAVAAVEAAPGVFPSPALPARPATVFAFPDGPPDGRWRPTDLPVNQARDNEPPLTVKGA
jgi:hypothetical protein